MFGKKNYYIELSHSSSIVAPEITSTPNLINFIIEENQKLIEDNEVGQIIVRKFLESKKQVTLLYAQILDLPMSEETNFDDLLVSFYSKKLLPFDSRLIDDELLVSELKENLRPSETEDDEGYAEVPIIDNSDEEEPIIAEELSEPSNDTRRTEITVPVSTLLTEAAIKEIVAKEMKDKDEEIERLKKSLRLQGKEEMAKVENPPVKDDNVSEAILATPLVSSDLSEDINVLDVIKMVKYDANKRLEYFIAQETSKINAEIEALDTRDKIEPTLSKRFGDEKKLEIEELNRLVDSKKAEEISTENARHEAALKSIESESEANRAKHLEKLTEAFATKLSSAIKEEYQRQTEQLNLILQGKTEELLLHQKAVNEGMKNTVSEVLEGFNTNHGEFIQNIERRKNSSSLIPLHKRVG
ncbi:hypothetical protein [Lactococcus lactis]|uniref:Uncharacterized protein n=1 Tax=Lactococcus lactis TaxID=1358 RepID=A0AAP8E1I0_9LACT|nr:hypothetical protein [Lactococcus lactis]MDG4970491.1 hypothetical protein [Lactococcus lactis]PFG89198.1 hypothetical protein BW154_06900 [Lactococcus lactis]